MTKIAAPGIATALALALLAGSAGAGLQRESAEVAPIEFAAPAAPQEHVIAPGLCQIRYDGLPADRQPAAMECEHADWLARTWGGQLMEMTETGLIERAAYEGRNDFTDDRDNEPLILALRHDTDHRLCARGTDQ